MARLGNGIIVDKLEFAAEFWHGGHCLNVRDAHCLRDESGVSAMRRTFKVYKTLNSQSLWLD